MQISIPKGRLFLIAVYPLVYTPLTVYQVRTCAGKWLCCVTTQRGAVRLFSALEKRSSEN